MRPRRTGGRGLAAVFGAAVLMAAAPAGARADTWKGIDLTTRMARAPWHVGPLIIQPTLVLANAGVDSNVFYSPTDPVRDFTLTAGPAATIYVPIARRFVLSATGSPQYVWYSKTERERTWNFYFSGSAQLNLRRVFFSLDGVYSDARERWNTEIDIRPRRKETGAGGSMLVQLAWRTSFALAYRTVKYGYENIDVTGAGFNVKEQLNRRESYGTFSFYFQPASTRRFFLDFEYGRYAFEFPVVSDLKDSQSYAGYGGFEFSQIGTRVRGRIRLGYKHFHLLHAEGGPDYRGLAGDTLLSVRLAQPIAVRASFVRDVRFSLWYGNAYYLETRPGAGLSLYPFRLIRLDYDFSVGRNHYPLAGGGGQNVKRSDEFTLHAVGLYVRVSRTSALGFIVSRWQRDSNIPTEDDKRTFFGLNLTYDF